MPADDVPRLDRFRQIVGGLRNEAPLLPLDSLIDDRKIRKGGVLARPVGARISGAAFFDGQHRRGGRRSDRVAGDHGRCNSSVRALWEIHPVYRVTSP